MILLSVRFGAESVEPFIIIPFFYGLFEFDH